MITISEIHKTATGIIDQNIEAWLFDDARPNKSEIKSVIEAGIRYEFLLEINASLSFLHSKWQFAYTTL
ncbi:hypothetical protein [Spiroplasma endosymbiont of Crioceris asparagi]|uniref:hypothetical protein n=1 Tax=Spiroplasma endosymbiont of Crioceris asparagi TaxID=3066286 RepID=UPI0030D4BAB4